MFFWYGVFLKPTWFRIGLSSLLISLGCLFMGVADIMLQWSSALLAGHDSPGLTIYDRRRFGVHAVIIANSVHWIFMLLGATLLRQSAPPIETLLAYIAKQPTNFVVMTLVHLVTAILNLFAIVFLGRQLSCRIEANPVLLLEHRHRSMRMTFLSTFFLAFSLVLQVALSVIFLLLIAGLEADTNDWIHQSSTKNCSVAMVFMPAICISMTYVCLMRGSCLTAKRTLFIPSSPATPPLTLVHNNTMKTMTPTV
jgi:hypothetical protein